MPRFVFEGGRFDDLSGVPLERIEAEMCALSAQVEAGLCRWLLLVAEFDRRAGYESWGMLSTAHWLAWRCAISRRTARDYARVARALPALPVTVAAFAAGELSYCKVRALTRIATPGTETELVAFAKVATTAQLELAVSTYRRCEAATLADALRQRAERGVDEYSDEQGLAHTDARLPAEEGAILAKALDAAMDLLDKIERAECDDGEGPFSDAHSSCSGPDVECEAHGAEGGSHEPQDAAAAGSRPRREVHGRSADPGGSREPQTRAAGVRREPGEERPSWGQRRADALTLLARAFLESPRVPSGDDRYLVVVHADADVVSGERDDEWARCHLEHGAPIAAATIRRLLCDEPAAALLEDKDGNPLFMGRKTRFANRAQRRAVSSREQGRCVWPGCGRRLRHVHHVQEWSAEDGPTDIDRLVGLCPFHHRFVHEGGGRVDRDDETGAFRFFSRTGAEIAPVPRAARESTAAAASGATVEEANRAAGVAVVDGPASGYGERMDLDHTITAMFSLFEWDERRRNERN